MSDPGKAWGRWEKVARLEQGPGARRATSAPHNQHDPLQPPRSSPTPPGHAHLQVPGTLGRQLPCRLACWEFTSAHVMLLQAGKRGAASPGRLPATRRPLGPGGRLGASLRPRLSCSHGTEPPGSRGTWLLTGGLGMPRMSGGVSEGLESSWGSR